MGGGEGRDLVFLSLLLRRRIKRKEMERNENLVLVFFLSAGKRKVGGLLNTFSYGVRSIRSYGDGWPAVIGEMSRHVL